MNPGLAEGTKCLLSEDSCAYCIFVTNTTVRNRCLKETAAFPIKRFAATALRSIAANCANWARPTISVVTG
jgi:hypothetical protein